MELALRADNKVLYDEINALKEDNDLCKIRWRWLGMRLWR